MTELLPGPTCQAVCHTSLSSSSRSRAEADLVSDLWFCSCCSQSLIPLTLFFLGLCFWGSQTFSSTTVPHQRPSLAQPPPPLPITSSYLSTALGICRSFPPPRVSPRPFDQPIPIHFSYPPAPPPLLCFSPVGLRIFVLSSGSVGPLWSSMTSTLHPLPTIPHLPASFD